MQTPSPSPSAPAPSSLASLSQQPTPNQTQDHVTHHGETSAWPSISFGGHHILELPPTRYTSLATVSRDAIIPHVHEATSNDESVWEACRCAAHADSTGSTHSNCKNHGPAAGTGCFGQSSFSLTPGPLNPVVPVNYGGGDMSQNVGVENSQAHAFNSYSNSIPRTQISQPTSGPNPAVSCVENAGMTPEMCVQVQFPTSEEPGDHIPAINQTNMEYWDPTQTSIKYPLPNLNWGFFNPQDFPGQMTHPQMAFNTVPYPLGYPFQMYTPPRPRIYCPWPLCMESFARPSDLERHRQSIHLGIKYHCFWPGCHNNHGNGYVRCDKLRAHQKEKHGFA